MIEFVPNTYNEVAYPGLPFAQTHPDRLATIATLLGMKPAPVVVCWNWGAETEVISFPWPLSWRIVNS
jgi:hypothetical protein